MPVLAYIVGACLAGTVASLALAALVAVRVKASWVPTLVSYAVGALLGAAFLDVLPHVFREGRNAERIAAFVLAGAFAGLAGGLFGIFNRGVFPDFAYWTKSSEVLIMTLLGGMGTFYGPVVGALIVVSMQNYLAQFGEWVTVIQGVVFVACVLAFRRGIVGELAARAKISL